MSTRTPQQLRLRRTAWLVSLWQVAAGAVIALGLTCLWLQTGLAIASCLFVSLFLLALTSFWSIRSETQMRWQRIMGASAWSSLGLVAVIGLCQVFRGYGFLAVLLLAVLSPWTVQAISRVRDKTSRSRRTAPEAYVGLSADPELLDRRFRELVADLEREERNGP